MYRDHNQISSNCRSNVCTGTTVRYLVTAGAMYTGTTVRYLVTAGAMYVQAPQSDI